MRTVVVPRRNGTRGQALVEFAVIAPLLFFLIAGAAQVALVVYDQLATETAAREGARTAAENPNSLFRNSSVSTIFSSPSNSYSCSGSDWTTVSPCIAVRNSTTQSLGLINPSSLTATLSAPVGPTANNCPVDDGAIKVVVTYQVPIFVPFVATWFADTAGGATRTVKGNMTMRVEPCAATTNN